MTHRHDIMTESAHIMMDRRTKYQNMAVLAVPRQAQAIMTDSDGWTHYYDGSVQYYDGRRGNHSIWPLWKISWRIDTIWWRESTHIMTDKRTDLQEHHTPRSGLLWRIMTDRSSIITDVPNIMTDARSGNQNKHNSSSGARDYFFTCVLPYSAIQKFKTIFLAVACKFQLHFKNMNMYWNSSIWVAYCVLGWILTDQS